METDFPTLYNSVSYISSSCFLNVGFVESCNCWFSEYLFRLHYYRILTHEFSFPHSFLPYLLEHNDLERIPSLQSCRSYTTSLHKVTQTSIRSILEKILHSTNKIFVIFYWQNIFLKIGRI